MNFRSTWVLTTSLCSCLSISGMCYFWCDTADCWKKSRFSFFTRFILYCWSGFLVPQWQFMHREPYDVFHSRFFMAQPIHDLLKWQIPRSTCPAYCKVLIHHPVNIVPPLMAGALWKIGTMQFPCLRVKREYIQYGDKDFVYLTKDGAFITLMTSASNPDSGIVSGGTILLAANLVDVRCVASSCRI